MPINLTWSDIILRLALTMAGSALFGLDRSERGRQAGLRTTMLVALAACASMLDVNALLNLSGKASDSFIVMDLMRLPLGILSGIGFIGGGAILRRGSLVTGVTTAATLWYVTVLGLCFGGGQIAVGVAMTVVGLFVAIVLKKIENRLKTDRHAALVLVVTSDGPDENTICQLVTRHGLRVQVLGITYSAARQLRKYRCQVQWRAVPDETELPAFVEEVRQWPAVRRFSWNPT